MQELHLNSAGWLRPRTDQGWRVGFETQRLWLQTWVMQKDGGLREARKLAESIAASYAA